MFKFLKDRKKKDNKGFTLVELVIVVAILAILVGLLAPQYTKYVEKTRKAADVSNMDEMVKAVQVYAADAEGDIPTGTYTITISKNKETDVNSNVVDRNSVDVIEKTIPDYKSTRLKSARWGSDKGSDVTATIKVDENGGTTVTYEPADFATMIAKKGTPETTPEG